MNWTQQNAEKFFETDYGWKPNVPEEELGVYSTGRAIVVLRY